MFVCLVIPLNPLRWSIFDLNGISSSFLNISTSKLVHICTECVQMTYIPVFNFSLTNSTEFSKTSLNAEVINYEAR